MTSFSYSGLCVGGPHDGKFMMKDKSVSEMFRISDTTKDSDGLYTSATFEKMGEYRYDDGEWLWSSGAEVIRVQ